MLDCVAIGDLWQEMEDVLYFHIAQSFFLHITEDVNNEESLL